jgi:hypothetical protein
MGFTKRNQKKITKRNEILLLTKQNETKRNFTPDETKRNETKFRCFHCFAKQAKFRETNFLFRFVSCFARQKKACEMETLVGKMKPFLVHQFLKISSFSYRKFDYKMFSGDFLLNPFSVNDSCYGSGGRLIRAIFIWNILCFAELQRKILQVPIRAQTRYHICASCIHGSLFLLTQDTNAEHLLIENSDMKTTIFLKM